jgi:endonuclease YncB( thermonuclease family)
LIIKSSFLGVTQSLTHCPVFGDHRSGQAFGQKAKQFTASMVFRRYVKIEPVDTDRYGRTVAWVYVNGKNLCEELVSVATKIDGNMMKNGQEQRGKRDGAPSRSLAGS